MHGERGHRGHFVLERAGVRLGMMTYSRVNEGLIIIDHTEVDRRHEGQGLARKLLDTAVQWARATGTKVMATCPYATAQFDRDPAIRDVLA